MNMSTITSVAGRTPLSQSQSQAQCHTRNAEEVSPKGHVDDFDWSVLDHSREMFFLPGVDRLAAHLASKSDGPVKVRVESQGQFLEYTLDGKHPENSVSLNLNGVPYEMKASTNPDGSLQFDGEGTPGKVNLSIEKRPEGQHASALVVFEEGQMALTQKMVVDPDPKSSRMAEVIGNFACAKLYEEFLRGDDGKSWEIMGDMGNYPIFGKLTANPDGSYLVAGSLGDLEYKQTITPVSGSTK